MSAGKLDKVLDWDGIVSHPRRVIIVLAASFATETGIHTCIHIHVVVYHEACESYQCVHDWIHVQWNLFITDTKGTGISVRFREVGFIWISVSQGPCELSVIDRCP